MDVLLNWLGQGAVVAFLAAAVLRIVPRSRPQARYAVLWAACSVVLALPVAPELVGIIFAIPTPVDASTTLSPMVAIPAAWWTSTALAVGLWILWSVASAIRLAAAAAALRASRQQCRECPGNVQARFQSWSAVRATGRQTRVVLSTAVRSAAVLGGGAPVIALAPALLDRLSDADLDRVVIHEWAHVQRRDDVALLVQRLVRVIVGWHPAMWWLERHLELEREVACDGIAVAVTGSAKGYAACLATLASLPTTPIRSLPMLAVVSSSAVGRRIARILAVRRMTSTPPWRVIALGAGTAIAVLGLAVGHVQVVVPEAPPPSRSAPARPAVPRPMATDVPPTLPRLPKAAPPVDSATPRRSPSSKGMRAATRENEPAPIGTAGARATEPPSTSAVVVALPSQVLNWLIELPASGVARRVDDKAQVPWAAAADAGVAIGRGSQTAGLAAAGFFSRFGKRVAALR